MIWKYQSAEIVWFEFAKIKGAKIILHVKSPTFGAAKLKGFTITSVKWRHTGPSQTSGIHGISMTYYC